MSIYGKARLGDFGPDVADFDEDESTSYVECKHCGKHGLLWEQDDNDRWLLIESNCEVHRCSVAKTHAHAAKMFDDLG